MRKDPAAAANVLIVGSYLAGSGAITCACAPTALELIYNYNMVVDLFLNTVGAACLLLPGAWSSKTKTKQEQFLFVLFILDARHKQK